MLTEGDPVTLICKVYDSSGHPVTLICKVYGSSGHSAETEFTVTGSLERPKAKVSIKPDQHVFGGDTVTLRCDIDGEGVTSWQYSWYKDGSNSVFSELQEHTFSPVTESDAGKYFCYGAERGGSQTSNIGDAVTLTVVPRAVLSVSPQKWLTEGNPVTLICEVYGSSTGWTFSWYAVSSVWASQTGSTCTFSSTITSDTGVYWCQSESGENYHPVNITVHSDVILESPVHPVTEGDNLTLRCLYQHSTPPNLRADFYKDESLIQNQTTEIISNVSKSHEGFYYCKHSERGESPKSWISVRVSHSESQISVLHTLSSVLAVCPYLLVSIFLKILLHDPFKEDDLPWERELANVSSTESTARIYMLSHTLNISIIRMLKEIQTS
ncbi:low affinity immunoglobulin gamma Fc region receptor III-like [Sinocyclocheilus grahami]|uniref:low affinity immunoglobulin gamma Fc region receptor III-like n=1 Tax=Sinocyclocheilus grahami TaxID=75366 RepID=UPI0007AD073F|nr:PREDICTED: low affinity immunoglobulin gamma Fc region receptor III-like [Sinocyclocheilus grahami]